MDIERTIAMAKENPMGGELRLVDEIERLRAKLAAMESQKPIGFFNNNRPGYIQWESGVFLTRAKDGDPIYAAAPSHSQQSAEYRCHKCNKVTPPPEPFKFYVRCACGAATAATAALVDDRCPSHESKQNFYGNVTTEQAINLVVPSSNQQTEGE